MRVLVVDDSVVFRSQITNALDNIEGIEVVGTAAHGGIALQKLTQSSIDLVVLDMEMPEMTGLEFLREIKKIGSTVKVIVFSSQTQRGAEAALDALSAGAVDVVAKPSSDGHSFESVAKAIHDALVPKILQFSKDYGFKKTKGTSVVASEKPAAKKIRERVDLNKILPTVLLIGCSTGGPPALEKIFSVLKGPYRIPVLICQHMPPIFTENLAKRLGEMTGVPAGEGKHGEIVRPNRIYVAPGDFHMTIGGSASHPVILLDQSPQRNSVRPAVDSLFESGARIYGNGALSVVLTGMGEDGLIGARAVHQNGGTVVIQDKESSVVFGMPGAIYAEDEYDAILSLADFPAALKSQLIG